MASALVDAIIDLNEKAALSEVRAAYERGVDPLTIVEECRRGLEVVGERFDKEECFLSELVLGAEIFKRAMAILGPALATGRAAVGKPLGKVVIGTVKGDIHDLGKNIVIAMLSASGFEVTDLGVDVPEERFVEAIRAVRPQVVGMSTLLTLTFETMRDTITAIERAGLHKDLAIVIGGGPVNEKVKTYVGADAVGYNAAQAVAIVKRVVGVS